MTTPPTPRTLYVSSIRLAAVLTAVRLSREFTRQTLRHWQLNDQIDSAEIIVSELVTNGVKTTGLPQPQPKWSDIRGHHVIGVQLRLLDASLYVEVWDPGTGTPVVPEQHPDAEGGRGLFLVEALSKRWDVYRPRNGGKIVWAELALHQPDDPTPRREAHPQRDPGNHDPTAGQELDLLDMALMQRVLDGLRQALQRDVEVAAV
jgi:anti-sigma regulatory factor (Ser/Thr protein kinase)